MYRSDTSQGRGLHRWSMSVVPDGVTLGPLVVWSVKVGSRGRVPRCAFEHSERED